MEHAKKLHELTINVSSQSRTNLITNTTFFTMDVQTGKKIINFTLENEPLDLTNAIVMLAFDFVNTGTSKIIDSEDGSVTIENAEQGQCSVVLPNHLYEYSGQVLVHTYILFDDGRSLDAGVIVTEFEESWLDQELDEMTEFYVRRFENLADEIKERANVIRVEIEEAREDIENVKTKIKQFKSDSQESIKDFVQETKNNVVEAMNGVKSDIKDFNSSVKDDIKNTLIEIQNQVKEKIIEAETEFLNLNEEIKSKLREKLEDLNSAAELKEAIKELMKEMKGQFETDVEAILQTTTEIREQIESDKVSILDFHEHLADDEIHVTVEDRERWNSVRPSEFSIQSTDGSVRDWQTMSKDELDELTTNGELVPGQYFTVPDAEASVLDGFVSQEDLEAHVGDESHTAILPGNHFTPETNISNYPRGFSVFHVSGAAGWPSSSGTVETLRIYDGRMTQNFTDTTRANPRRWYRIGHWDSPNVGRWSNWQHQADRSWVENEARVTRMRSIRSVTDWNNLTSIHNTMSDGDVVNLVSVSGSVDGPFGGGYCQGFYFRFDNFMSGNGLAMAYSASSPHAHHTMAIRRLSRGNWFPWRYPTTTTTFTAPITFEGAGDNDENVEVSRDILEQFLLDKMSNDEKQELCEYAKTKLEEANNNGDI